MMKKCRVIQGSISHHKSLVSTGDYIYLNDDEYSRLNHLVEVVEKSDDEISSDTNGVDYESMTVKELQQLAKDNNIEVGRKAKKSHYIKALKELEK
jgi:autotransporter adhesin